MEALIRFDHVPGLSGGRDYADNNGVEYGKRGSRRFEHAAKCVGSSVAGVTFEILFPCPLPDLSRQSAVSLLLIG